MFILLFLSSPVLSHQRSFINIACCHVFAVVERISYTRKLPLAAWVAGSVEVIETEAILCHIRETNGSAIAVLTLRLLVEDHDRRSPFYQMWMIKNPLWHRTCQEVKVERQLTAVRQYTWHLKRINILINYRTILVLASYWIIPAREQPFTGITYQFVEIISLIGREVCPAVAGRPCTAVSKASVISSSVGSSPSRKQ